MALHLHALLGSALQSRKGQVGDRSGLRGTRQSFTISGGAGALSGLCQIVALRGRGLDQVDGQPMKEFDRAVRQLSSGRLPSFCVANVDESDIAAKQFGDEGQRWELMSAAEFTSRNDAVPQLQLRLARHPSVAR